MRPVLSAIPIGIDSNGWRILAFDVLPVAKLLDASARSTMDSNVLLLILPLSCDRGNENVGTRLDNPKGTQRSPKSNGMRKVEVVVTRGGFGLVLLTSNEPNHNWSAILSGSLDAYAGLDLVSAREVRRRKV